MAVFQQTIDMTFVLMLHILSLHSACTASMQAAIRAVTGTALDTLNAQIQAMPTLGDCSGAVTRSFMNSVGQLSQLDLVCTEESPAI